ncbi:DUF6049 family protein [Brevibacterium sp. BRM-1]|uniref:DUF6049 family protein n=1 Tax=Brevibacterium sp. BRM-1 TaxID=2999062 RepID=UPI00228016C4|nr:DUF6049 family protein [Brevibacterium sp. BRM-1]WAL39549.1 DUF6049 family protein [Brevibacterium sp. BRM-1]
MTRRSTRRATRAASALAAAALAASPLLVGTPAAAQPAASPQASASSSPAEAQAATVAVTEVTPWLDKDGTLTLSGTITARTEVRSPRLSLGISRRILDSRDRIESWSASPSQWREAAAAQGTAQRDTSKHPIAVPDMPATLAAGSTTRFRFTVPASRLGLSTSEPLATWGPRGLRVGLTGSSEREVTADPATAFTTWYPKPSVQPTRLTGLVPVTLTAFGQRGLIAADALDDAVGKNGALTAALAAARAERSTALAIDPRIVASVQAALSARDDDEDDDASPGATDAPSAAPDDEQDADHPQLRAWWEDFRAEAAKHSIVALPWGDADLTALSAAGLDAQTKTARASADIVRRVFPKARTDIAWPASGAAGQQGLQTARRAGDTTAVLADTQQPGTASYTQSAHSRLSLGGEGSDSSGGSDSDSELGTLIVDTRLSALAGGLGDPQTRAAAMSELVAQTAAITSERPSDSRTVLMALPRTGADPSWQRATALASQLPWLKGDSLGALLDSKAVQRGPLEQPAADSDDASSASASPASTGAGSTAGGSAGSQAGGFGSTAAERTAERTRSQGLDADSLRPLGRPAAELERYAAIFTDPQAARTADSRMLLTCASLGWRLTGSQADCTAKAKESAHSLTTGIDIEQGSSVLLVTGEKTTLPITVENRTDRSAAMTVRLTPETPQLRAQGSERLELKPGERTRVEVPIEGIANADVRVGVSLIADNGFVVPGDSHTVVRVRADWENIGTAVVGGGVGLVFVVGLVGTIRRGRRKIPANQLDAALGRVPAGPDAPAHPPERDPGA